MFANKTKVSAYPFHAKSTTQPSIQNSVALKNYLEETKLEFFSTVLRPERDNISANERKALLAQYRINLQKADKGTTTVIMDTVQKIQEGLQQLSDDKFYKPITSIVLDTARKVNAIVNKLFRNIDKMTYKWLKIGLKQPEFYTLTKIHKKTSVGRPIFTSYS